MKILVLSDSGAISFYRGHGAVMAAGFEVLHPRNPEHIDWIDIMPADAILMTRALLPEHVEICRQVKAVGKPLILDYDDAIFSVPVSNPCWEEHLKFPDQAREACELADLVLFSTEGVKKDFLMHGAKPKDSRVVRNRAAWGLNPTHNSTSTTVAWRGSPTHNRDIDLYINEIVEYCKTLNITEFRFFGYLHDALLTHLTRSGIKATFEPQKTVHAYMNALKELAPYAIVIPLVKGHFNNAKSDIAATEALAAGAMPIVFGNHTEFFWCEGAYEANLESAKERDLQARKSFVEATYRAVYGL